MSFCPWISFICVFLCTLSLNRKWLVLSVLCPCVFIPRYRKTCLFVPRLKTRVRDVPSYRMTTRAKDSNKLRFLGDVMPKVLWQGLRKPDHQDFLKEERRLKTSAKQRGNNLSNKNAEIEAPLVQNGPPDLLVRACEFLRPTFNSRKWYKDLFAPLPNNSRRQFDEIVEKRGNTNINLKLKQENHDCFHIKFCAGNRVAFHFAFLMCKKLFWIWFWQHGFWPKFKQWF